MNCHFHAPMPDNVPACSMAPGMKEREELKKELARQSALTIEIPVIINGKEIYTEKTRTGGSAAQPFNDSGTVQPGRRKIAERIRGSCNGSKSKVGSASARASLCYL